MSEEIIEIEDSPPHNTLTTMTTKEQSSACSTPQNSQSQNSILVDFFKERSMRFKEKELKEREKIKKSFTAPEIPLNMKHNFPVVVPRNRMAQKLASSTPYNFFLTTVTSSVFTHSDPHFVTFQEILDPSLGDLESSIQVNFTVDFDWLFSQYKIAGLDNLPLLVLYGEGHNQSLIKGNNNFKSKMVEISRPYGCHHTKMMILMYKDKSMRIVISTANLYRDDWDNRVQGLWISEKLSYIENNNDGNGESVTEFRKDLIEYLTTYNMSELESCINHMKQCDFSSIKVYLITSVPGDYYGNAQDKFGLKRIEKLLPKDLTENCPLVIQSSSIGNFGKHPSWYLSGEVLKSFGGNEIRMIYPSLSNVEESYDGLNLRGCGCMLYRQEAHNQQKWLNNFLYKWKSEDRKCTRSMPHIKTYSRFSKERLYWFILASHNISKSAWGCSRKNKTFSINSYEVGIAFLPQIILNGNEYFPLKLNKENEHLPIFKLPFDTELIPYDIDDVPFCIDYATNL